MLLKIFCTLQLMLISIIAVHAVPASYCLYPINKTDCGGQPTPVFSYYKSGSRCEIEIWRGCPSYNRFDSLTTCSHYCIARMSFEENEITDDESCEGKLNNGDCGENPLTVYTFNRKTNKCEKAEWRGCKTSNKFYTESLCNKECIPKKERWEETIKKMSNQDIDEMNKLVDEILKEDKTKLKNTQVKVEPTVPAATEPNTEPPATEEPATPEPAAVEPTTEEPKDPVNEVEAWR